MVNPQVGFQPRTTPAERRAFYHLQRRHTIWVGPEAPTDPTIDLWYDTDEPVDEIYTQAEVDALLANHYTEAEVDALLPKSYTATGVANSAVTAVSPTTCCTLVVPAQPVAGRIFVTAFLRIDKTIAATAHTVSLADGSTEIAQNWPTINSAQQFPVTFTASVDAPASTARTFTTVVVYSSGTTGTITTYANASLNRIDAIWMAT